MPTNLGVLRASRLGRCRVSGGSRPEPAAQTAEQFRYSFGNAISKEESNEPDAITELAEFPDRGLSLNIDAGWRAVADQCLTGLGKQDL